MAKSCYNSLKIAQLVEDDPGTCGKISFYPSVPLNYKPVGVVVQHPLEF